MGCKASNWEVDGRQPGLPTTLFLLEELNHNSKDRKKEALKKAHLGCLPVSATSRGPKWKFDGYYVGVLLVSRSLQYIIMFSMDEKGPLDILLNL